jgi:hypothetical protein
MPRPTPSVALEDIQPTAPALTEQEVKSIAEAKRVSLIDYMRDWLAAQPKRRVRARNDGDIFVQINGYSLLIQPNVYVDVPEPVVMLLEEAGYL